MSCTIPTCAHSSTQHQQTRQRRHHNYVPAMSMTFPASPPRCVGRMRFGTFLCRDSKLFLWTIIYNRNRGVVILYFPITSRIVITSCVYCQQSQSRRAYPFPWFFFCEVQKNLKYCVENGWSINIVRTTEPHWVRVLQNEMIKMTTALNVWARTCIFCNRTLNFRKCDELPDSSGWLFESYLSCSTTRDRN